MMSISETEKERYAFTVEVGEKDQRLDAFLSLKLLEVSRSRIQRAIAERQATVDGAPRKPSYKVQPGEQIEFWLDALPDTAIRATAESLPLEVIHEDEAILVVNKPRGMVTHPAIGVRSGTLVNALLGYASQLSSGSAPFRPGILHRLDKDTSGLLLVAKNDTAHFKLAKAMEKREIERRYLALVWGEPKWETIRVDAPLGRSETDRKKVAIMDEEGKGRQAITDFKVLQRFKGFSLLEAKLHTGRTHQVRVHASFAHHPLVADPAYGGVRRLPKEMYPKAQREQIEAAIEAMNGQTLHAYKLSFEHPVSGENVTLYAPMPSEVQSLIDLLEAKSSESAS